MKKLNKIRIFIFILLLSHLTHATIFSHKYKGYIVERSIKPDFTYTALIKDPKGTLIVEIENYNFSKDTFEVQDNKFFWRNHTDKNKQDWINTLWVLDLKTKKKEKLLELKGLAFKVAPNGKDILIKHNEELKLYNLKSKKFTPIYKNIDTNSNIGLLDWSEDSTKFWFELGLTDTWHKFGVYSNNQIQWFKHNINAGSRLEPNLGWFAEDDRQFQYDSFSEEIYSKTNPINNLKIIDLKSNKVVVIDSGVNQDFKPQWISKDELQYIKDSKKIIVPTTVIQEKLNSAKSSD